MHSSGVASMSADGRASGTFCMQLQVLAAAAAAAAVAAAVAVATGEQARNR